MRKNEAVLAAFMAGKPGGKGALTSREMAGGAFGLFSYDEAIAARIIQSNGLITFVIDRVTDYSMTTGQHQSAIDGYLAVAQASGTLKRATVSTESRHLVRVLLGLDPDQPPKVQRVKRKCVDVATGWSLGYGEAPTPPDAGPMS